MMWLNLGCRLVRGGGVAALAAAVFFVCSAAASAQERAAAGAASDLVWRQVTDGAPWSPRAGALVHRGRMWLLGGWNPGDRAHFPRTCNNEVRSSADGVHWQQHLAAAWWVAGLVLLR